jgi:uncharacterized protein
MKEGRMTRGESARLLPRETFLGAAAAALAAAYHWMVFEQRGSIQRFGVMRLDVFGSALRDDFRSESSDIDLLVQFKPMNHHDLVDAYFGLLYDLRDILGTEVDLVMSDAVRNRYIAAEIERTKQVLYAA